MKRQVLSRYIVIDPEICHGKPTFLGTRILVADVLDQVAGGRDWEAISKAWGGKVSTDAIADAVSLAVQAFTRYVQPEQDDTEAQVSPVGSA